MENEKNINSNNTDTELDVVYLNGANSEILALGGDFISLRFNGTLYERVAMSRAMPFSDPDSYIIVKGADKEIGIIRNISDFENDARALIQKHLAMRYYCPKIKEIREVKDKFGFIYVTVETDSGEKNFASADLTKSIKRISGDRYIIVDVEGNRFLIEDLLKVKNHKKILAYIV